MSIISLAGSIRVKDPYFFGFEEGLNLTKYKNYKVIIHKETTAQTSFTMTQDTREGLEEIKDILEQGRVLRAVLGVAAFTMLFSESPDPNKVISLVSEDWERMGKILRDAGSIDKIAAKKTCEHYIYVYEGVFKNKEGKYLRNNENRQFWQNLKKTFE